MTTSDWTGNHRRPVGRRRGPASQARLAVTLLAASVVLLTGCGSSDRSALPPSTHATSLAVSPSTAAKPDPTQAVLAAYRTYSELWLEDNNPPSPDDPRLAAVETGQALDRDRAVMRQFAAQGEVIRKPAHSLARHDERATLSPGATSATVVDCAVDDGLIIVESSGAIVNDKVETQLWSATLVLVEGHWKVSTATITAKWDGVRSCSG